MASRGLSLALCGYVLFVWWVSAPIGSGRLGRFIYVRGQFDTLMGGYLTGARGRMVNYVQEVARGRGRKAKGHQMNTNRIKQHTVFAFTGKATQWRITRTVGETVYYRLAKTPYYMYSDSPLYTTVKSELASRAYEIVQVAR